MASARYVALNPLRARLVERAQDWPWSSVRAHLAGRDDPLVEAALSRSAGRFADLLDDEPDAERPAALRATEGIGRPLGSEAFLDRLAALMGRPAPREAGAQAEIRGGRTSNWKLKKLSPETQSRFAKEWSGAEENIRG